MQNKTQTQENTEVGLMFIMIQGFLDNQKILWKQNYNYTYELWEYNTFTIYTSTFISISTLLLINWIAHMFEKISNHGIWHVIESYTLCTLTQIGKKWGQLKG